MSSNVQNDPALRVQQIADMCSVSATLVRRWIDAGELSGWRIPMSRDRRARLSDVVAFAEKHGMKLQASVPQDGGASHA